MSNTQEKYWFGKAPGHWNTVRVKSLFRLACESSKDNHGMELLSVYTDIGVKPRKELEQKGNKASTTDGYWIVRKGDLVVNKLLAWMGAVGYSEYNGVTSPAYDILRARTTSINPKFYHYLFRLKLTQGEFRRWSKGIMDMRLRLYFSELGNVFIPCPPLSEQNAIVEFIDNETDRIDQLIEKKEKLNQLINEKRKNTISSAVLGLDAPFSRYDRKEIKLKFVVDIISQKVPYGSIGATYIGLEHIKPWTGEIIEENDAQPEGLVSKFKSGDVLFGKLRPNLAKAALPNFDGVCSTEALVLRPRKTKIDASYLRYCLSEQTFIEDVVGSTYGAKMPRASWEFIGSRRLLLPDVGVQSNVVRQLNSYTKSIDKLINLSEESIKSLENFKISLITEAVTGQLDIKSWKKRGSTDERLDNIEESMRT
ncbi:restriction endonuclease subunit S [Legionella pneumophila serogroup 1]|nr:restriction endonuclease subunit S [Legionella pneumophila]HAT8975196.1 hypothetical protein [Legionella pneumophila subsp. pneumophila]MCK1856873.1 restriction endonuclease subunit S [Legionella pneumophila]HAT2073885.1 hypothetical protein [Legionella pneumophila]HAT9450991.1 hypothetical protein [Legionella pneumophila subsp. pneumophila]HAT9454026.1 hypothetical protein [Legionella pneumophila subsp. pneumophila]